MKINIKNIDINYTQYGEGKDIVLLHGWGQNIEMMKPIGDNLCINHRITILDLPGFGESEEPKEVWNIGDYSNMLEEFLNRLDIKKPVIMGHSFGGRIAIRYSANHSIEKLVLFGSPCIRIQEELPLYVNLSKYAREIEEPTLLIWGEQDTEAPLKDAKELEKIMIDAGLVVLPGTHYAYLENLGQVINILNNFL